MNKEKIDGYGALFRFITPTLVLISIAILTFLATDIKELKREIVYKCDYIEDVKTVVHILEKLDDRIRTIETKKE